MKIGRSRMYRVPHLTKAAFVGLLGASLAAYPYEGQGSTVCGPFSSDRSSSSPFSAPDTLNLEVVQVKAPALPRLGSRRMPQQTLNQTSLQRLNALQVSDAVKHLAGVTVKDFGGVGGLKTISVRSLGSAHTGVMVDGLMVNNSMNGQIDLGKLSLTNISQLSLTNIQDLCILQSARSLSTSSLINIESLVSPSPYNRAIQGKVQWKMGSFGFINPEISLQASASPTLHISLIGDYQQASGAYPFKVDNGWTSEQGHRQNSKTQQGHGAIKLDFKPSERHHLRIQGQVYGDHRQLPGPVIFYNPINHQSSGELSHYEQINYRWTPNAANTLQVLGKYSWEQITFRDNPLGSDDQQGLLSLYEQGETYLSAAYQHRFGSWVDLSIAADAFHNTMTSNLPLYAYPQRLSLLGATSATAHLKDFHLTGTLLVTGILENVKYGPAAPNRCHLAPQIALNYTPHQLPLWSFRTYFKDIFRQPTFNELYYTRMGNTQLKPEQAWQINIGAERSQTWDQGAHYIGVSLDAYANRVRDKIVAVPMSNLFEWSMSNIGLVQILGADLSLKAAYSPTRRIQLYCEASGSFQHAADISNPDGLSYGHQIPYTPLGSGSGILGCSSHLGAFQYQVLWSTARYALAQNLTANAVAGFAEHTLSWSRWFHLPGCAIRGSVECLNFTNQHYQVIKFYPMPGISLRIGCTLQF